MTGWQGFLTFVGRLALMILFVPASYKHLVGFSNFKSYMAGNIHASDQVLTLLLIGATACIVAGTVSVLFGLYGRVGALLLIVFLLGVSLGMHNFWAVPADQYQSQLGNFSKNMAIAGGLLFVVAFGPGPWSLDALRRRKSR